METKTIKKTVLSRVEKSIFLRVIEHGLNFPDGFKYDEFINGITIKGWERKIVDKYLEYAYLNNYRSTTNSYVGYAETPFFMVERANTSSFMSNDHVYIISYDANFKYIDYQELKFARETAKEAKTFSKVAIGISIAAFLASILVPMIIAKYFIQTVELGNLQFNSLQSLFNEKQK